MGQIIKEEDLRKATNIEKCQLLLKIINRTSSIQTNWKTKRDGNREHESYTISLLILVIEKIRKLTKKWKNMVYMI